jgi:hypothetical protein
MASTDTELGHLPADLQASLLAHLDPAEHVWCALDGGRAVIAATDRAAYLHHGGAGHPDWERLEWPAILDVTLATGERTALVVRRRGGRPVLLRARHNGIEAFLQCATILNLLAIRSRRAPRRAWGPLPQPDA